MKEKSSSVNTGDADASDELKKLRFQNYIPRTEELKKYCEEGDELDALLQQILDEQESLIRSANRKFADPALDLDNIVPRKGNWDMKRSLAPKLQRLEQRTKRTLRELLREKQASEGNLVSQTDDLHSISSDEG
ncbi:Coiled-coil domain-containing protein 12 [Gracilariopsis chorda]|uniref:Coiled-coil domain-containing protein 12 n=1 Tax=Gracilariopsis chorda TaxID=448386 RepID=A0A2V3J3Z1_9FLOR|nr:Coiled-coil domain-containing protein 12 [Gracilariopsis chorda]|eukprot:PXF48100.1 Coiled-coil domain-containing protein 12 [Gracilariopsis chorda]